MTKEEYFKQKITAQGTQAVSLMPEMLELLADGGDGGEDTNAVMNIELSESDATKFYNGSSIIKSVVANASLPKVIIIKVNEYTTYIAPIKILKPGIGGGANSGNYSMVIYNDNNYSLECISIALTGTSQLIISRQVRSISSLPNIGNEA